MFYTLAGILIPLMTNTTVCRTREITERTEEYLIQHPFAKTSELAKQCRISEVYFRRIFTSCYNMTPKQFLIDIRINKAKQLLSEGALKINAVAVKCGFSNQYHFCRIFKERTGLTPTEYMKQHIVYQI